MKELTGFRDSTPERGADDGRMKEMNSKDRMSEEQS